MAWQKHYAFGALFVESRLNIAKSCKEQGHVANHCRVS